MSPDERSIGPPGSRVGEGRPTRGEKPADVEKVGTKPLITNTPSIARPRHGDGLAAMHRRRLPPLGACGCIRDPLTDRHRCGAQISDKQLQAAVEAAEHLLDRDLTPIFDADTLRELWRRGHHQLVDELLGGGR
jgi:hypothetical protein